MEYRLAFQYWYCELCMENWWGRNRKYFFVNFCFFGVAWIIVGWRGSGVGKKSYLGAAEIVCFSSQDISGSNKDFYSQIWFKCETPLIFFLMRNMFFFCRLCKNYWITYYTLMTSHVIWVDEIPDVMISMKKDKVKKHFLKIVSLNKFYIISHLLSLCVFMSIQNMDQSIPLNLGFYHGLTWDNVRSNVK